jgi:hypothetical protein
MTLNALPLTLLLLLQGGSFFNFSRLLLKVPEHTW